MATNNDNVFAGAATVSLGAYVTAGGAGSLIDVGHMKGPLTMTPNYENYVIQSERAFGPIKQIPIGATYKWAADLSEVTPEHLRIAFRQPSANLTGTSPDYTLRVGAPSEQYHQMSVVVPGGGSTGVRTFTAWKVYPESLGAVPFAKGEEQHLPITFDSIYDDSVTTADKFFKMVES